MGRRPGEPSIFDDDEDDLPPAPPEAPEGVNLYEGLLLEASTAAPTTPAPETPPPETEAPGTDAPSTAPPSSECATTQASADSPRMGKLLTLGGHPANASDGIVADSAKKGGRRGNPQLGCPPDAKRCLHVNALSEAPDKRCKRWRRKIEGGLLDDYCQAHSRDPKAIEQMQQIVEMGGKAAAAAAAAKEPKPQKTLFQVFTKVFKTQDEVEDARHQLTAAMFDADAARRIHPSLVAAGLAALKAMSEHIERYGAVTGAEGGHSYMRLIPGMDIVEYEDPQDAALTGPDLDKITAGIEQDRRNGIAPPPDIADCIQRYCGRKVRRRDKGRYDTA